MVPQAFKDTLKEGHQTLLHALTSTLPTLPFKDKVKALDQFSGVLKKLSSTVASSEKDLHKGKKNNPSRNRAAGHGWERELVHKLRGGGFPFAVTSRSESKARDDAKVDIINASEYKNGALPFNIQAKNYARPISYPAILAEMPKGERNVILHRLTAPVGASSKKIRVGDYAIMPLDDWWNYVQMEEDFKHLRKTYDEVLGTMSKKAKTFWLSKAIRSITPSPLTSDEDEPESESIAA